VSANTTVQRACVWAAPACLVLFATGLITSRYLVPPDPTASAEYTANFFAEHTNAFRFGILLVCFAGGLWIIWSAAMTVQMLRIKGTAPLAYAQLAMAACGTIEFVLPAYFWLAAAYRPHAPELQQTLIDLGWLPFDGMIQTVIWQNVTIGVAVLIDKRTKPIFPRWYGYLSLWCASLYLPAAFNVFFKDGPLAWNGLLAWWLLVGSVFPWLMLTVVLLFAAIRHQETEEAAAPTQPPFADDIAGRLAAVEERLEGIAQRT
jgi:hypothetical protein